MDLIQNFLIAFCVIFCFSYLLDLILETFLKLPRHYLATVMVWRVSSTIFLLIPLAVVTLRSLR